MNDDLGSTIKQIADMLNQDTLPENLKDLISLFAGAIEKNDSPDLQKKSSQTDDQSIKMENKDELAENLEMIRTVKNIMRKLNSKSDPRINLLMALKPFLNNNRQKKINNCITLLQITRLFETIGNTENNNF
ncbi:MAG: hypothetical protein HPY74_13220 [Firmicutes bacterium]|nr:hypothetical protein [Bacillota bacterium]